VNGLRISASITRPTAIICIGQNCAAHAAESGDEPPTNPIVFLKHPNTLRGANDDVRIPLRTERTDWEVELAVVVGAEARYSTRRSIHWRASVGTPSPTTSPSASLRPYPRAGPGRTPGHDCSPAAAGHRRPSRPDHPAGDGTTAQPWNTPAAGPGGQPRPSTLSPSNPSSLAPLDLIGSRLNAALSLSAPPRRPGGSRGKAPAYIWVCAALASIHRWAEFCARRDVRCPCVATELGLSKDQFLRNGRASLRCNSLRRVR